MGKVNSYMPPFAGTAAEKEALAAYLYREVLGKQDLPMEPHRPKEMQLDIPGFDPVSDDYVLLVWNDLGMHCISDNEKYFSFLPPANTLNAQLFRRGAKPELVRQGVIMEYQVEEGFRNPEKHSLFWDYETEIFGVDLPAGTGLMGKEVTGTMAVSYTHLRAHET